MNNKKVQSNSPKKIIKSSKRLSIVDEFKLYYLSEEIKSLLNLSRLAAKFVWLSVNLLLAILFSISRTLRGIIKLDKTVSKYRPKYILALASVLCTDFKVSLIVSQWSLMVFFCSSEMLDSAPFSPSAHTFKKPLPEKPKIPTTAKAKIRTFFFIYIL